MCTNMVVMEADEARGKVTVLSHTCFNSPVISTFVAPLERRHPRRLERAAAVVNWPTMRGVACRYGFEVHSVCICACAYY